MRRVIILLSLAVLWVAPAPAAEPAAPAQPRECWLKTPTVSVMTGFIYEPLKPYTVQKWTENLGDKFDADQWVRDFKAAGANHLVFYDKWIDGLVFHDTRTTGFKTKKDFLAELAPACQRGHLPLVLYFNALNDGNPEFNEWALLDRQGKPIVFAPNWPTRYQTLHSPFRQKALEQVRELMGRYGPLHGLWHDIFEERLNTSSSWTAEGYRKMFGEPFDKAPGQRLHEFNCRTLAGWLDEAAAIRREFKQDQCLFTSNGSGAQFLAGGLWADLVGSRLQYFFNEGHSFHGNDQLARMAWVLPRPLDINLLLNSSWFTPLTDAPPPSHLTPKQAIAATAIAVCQGAGVNWAITPGHAGTFGQDLQRAQAAGAWFRTVKPYVQGARPYADAAIVLGVQQTGCPGLPHGNPFWSPGRAGGAWQQALALGDALARRGVFSRFLYANPLGTTWPASLREFRAVLVPELAPLDETHLDRLRQYVKEGGRLIAFGHASMLEPAGKRRPAPGLADVLGVKLGEPLRFADHADKGTIRVDSEYDKQYGAHVLAGAPGEAWASDGSPMPHWVEVTLPRAIEIARVELVNREGPYQITDFEAELFAAGQWKKAASVQNAKTRKMDVKLTPPATAEKVRVRILKELYQGKDRQWADLAALLIFDAKGKEYVRTQATRAALTVEDAEASRAMGEAPSWPASAVRAEPAGAMAAARFQTAGQPAAILINRVGQGSAWYLAAGDGLLAADASAMDGLARLAGGEPTLTVSPDDARYRIILTRCGDSHVLHVIDSRADMPGLPPQKVSLSLLPARLGNFQQARLAGQDADLPLSRQGRQAILTVQPDPVASVVLR